MAKKRRQNKKKHGEVKETSGEFMSEVPESNEESWSGETPLSHLDSNSESSFEEQPDSIVDPIEEQMNFSKEEDEQPDFEQSSQEIVQDDYRESEEASETQEEYQEPESFAGETIGSFLSEHREARGISLKNISQSTKISLTNLEYLEADQLEALPDRAYVTGYVKSYARALSADQKTALALLEETYQSLGAVPREQEIVIPQAQNASTNQANFPIPIKLVAGAVCSLAVIIGLSVYFLNKEPSTDEALPQEVTDTTKTEASEIKPQTLNAETPLQSKVENTVKDEEVKKVDNQKTVDEIIAKPKPPVIATPIKKEELQAVKAQQEPKVEKKAEPIVRENVKEEHEEAKEEVAAKKKEKKKFYPLAGTLYQIDNSMSEERQRELLPSRFRVAPGASNQNIFITAVTGDSWLTYKSDNDQIRKFVLKKGRSLLVRADEARVFLGNLGAVKIFLNNQPLKVSSQTGVKSLVFPQENASSYVMPLFIYKENGTVQTSSDYILQNP